MKAARFHLSCCSGTSVMQLYANDVDGGTNGAVTFSLVDQPQFFAVSASGLVTTTAVESST
jgi:hypothetical protein